MCPLPSISWVGKDCAMDDNDVVGPDGGIRFGEQPIGPPQPNILETEVKGDISLYNPKQERVLVLNGPASDIWLLCDGEQSFEHIVQLIAAAYGVQVDAIRPDVEATISRFIAEGFLPVP